MYLKYIHIWNVHLEYIFGIHSEYIYIYICMYFLLPMLTSSQDFPEFMLGSSGVLVISFFWTSREIMDPVQ